MAQGAEATGTQLCSPAGSSSSLQWEMERHDGGRSVPRSGFAAAFALISKLFCIYVQLFVISITEHKRGWRGKSPRPAGLQELFWKGRCCWYPLFLGQIRIEHYSDPGLGAQTGAVLPHTATKNPTLLTSLKPKHGICIFSKLFFMVLIYM